MRKLCGDRSKRQGAGAAGRRGFAGFILLCCGLLALVLLGTAEARAQSADMLIDDFAASDLTSKLGTRWRAVSDRVMGGISEAAVGRDRIDGRACLRLTGEVRLENDGGFVRASLDLASGDGALDASGYSGLRLLVRGNGERYSLHLRTPDNRRPWQSYRAEFTAGPTWETVDLPFASFAPHRLETPLDVARLRRIGLVAIGRAFHADLAVAEIGFYR
ncbi:MAG: CIA30 family protein [Kiloniellales bacterium]|nr:CIA30 family protein [Kiloniellales bacterium]